MTDSADAMRDVSSTTRARANVYRVAEQLLLTRGWTQGHERAISGKLSLTEAVRVAVQRDQACDEPDIVRVARMRRHLRDIANTSSLLAWNDAPIRRFDDVTELLRTAADRFPSD